MHGNRIESLWVTAGTFLTVLRQASREWVEDDIPRLAAALAYYTLLSMAPFILIAVAVAAAVYGHNAAQNGLASVIREVAGPVVERAMGQLFSDNQHAGTGILATMLAVITMGFGASSVFVELQGAMNLIWHVTGTPGQSGFTTAVRLIRNRFISFLTVLVAGILLLISLAFGTWDSLNWLHMPAFARNLLSDLVVAALFAALYKVVPDVTLTWRDVVPGALIAATLSGLGKEVAGFTFHIRVWGPCPSPPVRPLSCSCGYITLHSCSSSVLSSARFTRGPPVLIPRYG